MSATLHDEDPRRPYGATGGALQLWCSRAPEVLLAGPSGTGKSRACLEKTNYCALKYAGMRGLLVRKTRESFMQSGQVTLKNDVIVPGQAIWYAKAGEWRYTNGSVLVTGGMDRVGKVMSAEYDLIYVQEATELSLEEWEHLLTRLRGGHLPYNQLLACANPAGPNHWLKRRAEAGILLMYESRHEDNPLLFIDGRLTERGAAYVRKLDALTGVRHQRLRLGRWVAAEGMVYDEFDTQLHIVPRFDPPKDWRRVWSVDFGYTHPFCFQAWAIEPGTDIMYRFAELYHSQLLVSDAAKLIRAWMERSGERFPEALVCDHDAEGRATLRQELGLGTVTANKSVPVGIQAVKARLRLRADGRPGLALMRDVALKRDQARLEAKLPTSTEEEVELYLWTDGIKDSEPVKAHDDGLDALRYAVMYVDKGGWTPEQRAAWARGDDDGPRRDDPPDGGGVTVPRPGPTPPPTDPAAEHEAYLREVDEIQAQQLRALIRRGW